MINIFDFKNGKISNFKPQSETGVVCIFLATSNENYLNDVRKFLLGDIVARTLRYNKYKKNVLAFITSTDTATTANFDCETKTTEQNAFLFDLKKLNCDLPNEVYGFADKKIEIKGVEICVCDLKEFEIVKSNNFSLNNSLYCIDTVDRFITSADTYANGETTTLQKVILQFDIEPKYLRFLFLQNGFDNELNITIDTINQAKTRLDKIIEQVKICKDKEKSLSIEEVANITKYSIEFTEAINNNFDTKKAIEVLIEMLDNITKCDDLYFQVQRFDEVLGLNLNL